MEMLFIKHNRELAFLGEQEGRLLEIEHNRVIEPITKTEHKIS
jgi:hypothetical protein